MENAMKKLAISLVVAGVIGLVAFACADGSNTTPCTTDADCATVADTPLCDDTAKVCAAAECSVDSQCQATDSGGSAACTADADCDAGDKCVSASSDNKHCVTPEDPAVPCDSFTPPTVAATADGTTFCADTAVNCAAPRCSGGTFP